MDVQVISLDFYGTLVDIVTIYKKVCSQIISNNKLDITLDELSLRWRQEQRTYEQQHPPPSYKEIIRLGLEDLAKKHGFVNNKYHEMLFRLWRDTPVYTEVPDTLERLGEKYKLVVCSNSSREFFELCAKKLPVTFDNSFLSEEIGYTKPHPTMYRQVINAYNINPRQVFHVASSQMDLKGTHDFGYSNCWINRHQETLWQETPKPDHEITKFDELLPILK